jgi:hypothetical protein
MVLTAYGALSPAIGLSCHRRQRGVSGLLGPTSPFRRLDASVETSGPRAFAVRAWRRSSDDARCVRPSCRGGTARIDKAVSTKRRSELFLRYHLDRANHVEMLQGFDFYAQEILDFLAGRPAEATPKTISSVICSPGQFGLTTDHDG